MIRQKPLKIKEIEISEKLYPRKELNEKLVREYVDCMQRGDIFPNLYVAYFKKRYYLIDGRHRLEALELLGDKFATCDVKDNFAKFDDIYLASVRANLKHGLRYTKLDRIKIALKLKELRFEIEDISKLVKIDIKELEKLGYYKATKVSFGGKSVERIKRREIGVGVVDSVLGKVISSEELDNNTISDFYDFLLKDKFKHSKENIILLNKIKNRINEIVRKKK
jgi:hypothetical protein